MNNPKTILIAGIVCFFVALGDLLLRCPTQVNNWHHCLSTFGWAGLIGVIAALVWLIYVTITRR
jgi:hypothetical protein